MSASASIEAAALGEIWTVKYQIGAVHTALQKLAGAQAQLKDLSA